MQWTGEVWRGYHLNKHYDNHMQSEYWQNIRQQVIERDRGRCVLCNTKEQLEVHHRTYENFGKEKIEDLTTLCYDCHVIVTDNIRRLRYEKKQNWELPDTTRVKAPERNGQGNGTKQFEVQDTRRSSFTPA